MTNTHTGRKTQRVRERLFSTSRWLLVKRYSQGWSQGLNTLVRTPTHITGVLVPGPSFSVFLGTLAESCIGSRARATWTCTQTSDATKRLNLQCHNTGPFITLKKKKTSLEASCVVTLQQTIFRTAKWLHISDVVEYLVANVFHEDRTLYNKLFGRQCGR